MASSGRASRHQRARAKSNKFDYVGVGGQRSGGKMLRYLRTDTARGLRMDVFEEADRPVNGRG